MHYIVQKLNNRAGGYHVHLFPLPYEFSMSTNLCGSDITSGHFNPFNKPARGGTTQEEFEVIIMSQHFLYKLCFVLELLLEM